MPVVLVVLLLVVGKSRRYWKGKSDFAWGEETQQQRKESAKAEKGGCLVGGYAI